jgi:hypothetical protein
MRVKKKNNNNNNNWVHESNVNSHGNRKSDVAIIGKSKNFLLAPLERQ